MKSTKYSSSVHKQNQKYENVSSDTLHVSIEGRSQGLATDMDETELYKLFSLFDGEIKEVVVFSTRESKRVGKVSFKLALSASDAMKTLRKKKLSDGSILDLRYWRTEDEILLLEASTGFEYCSTSTGVHCLSSNDACSSYERKQKKDPALNAPISDALIIDEDDVSITGAFIKDLPGSAFANVSEESTMPVTISGSRIEAAASITVVRREDTPSNESLSRKEAASSTPRKETTSSTPRKKAASSTPRKEAVGSSRKEGVSSMPREQSASSVLGTSSLQATNDAPIPIAPKKVSKTISKPGKSEKSSSTFEERVCEQIALPSIYKPICTSPEMIQYNKFLESHYKTVSSCKVPSTSALPNQAFLCLQQNRIIDFKITAGTLNSVKADAIVVPTESSTIKGANDGSSFGETTVLRSKNLSHSFVIQVVLPLSEQKSQDNSSCDKALRNCLSDVMKMRLGSVAFPGIKPEMIKSLIEFLCEMDPVNLHTVSIVLQKTDPETEAYKQVLSCLISESEGKDDLQTSRADIIWSWRENAGSFVPYTPAITNLLTGEYEKGSDITFFSIGDVMYSVDFTRMKQINLETNGERDVLQITSNGDTVMWECLCDNGFVAYSATDAAMIENIFQRRDELTSLTIQNRQYRFDFTAMKQINAMTGFKRSIIRHQFKSSTNSSKLVFLCNGEVVVNITSPSLEKLDAAKTVLEKKLKNLVFTKTIPYPTTSKSTLLSQIQAIAKKHKIVCEVGAQSESSTCPSKQVLKLQGLQASVEKALLKIQEKFLATLFRSGEAEYPKEWEVMSEDEQVKFVELPSLCKEYNQLYKKFHKTMNIPHYSIAKIQRVQNKHLWTRYQQSNARLQDKQSQVNEKELFHGTRTNPAKTICSSEEGFDMRYSREGMWGCANYFAVKASYSDNYSYYDQNTGTCEMILAKVFTGDSFSCESDPSLRMPPLKNHGQAGAGKLQQVRYDSVNGVTHGCRVFMTYSNDLAYPAFIITYVKLPVQPQVQNPAPSATKKSSSTVKAKNTMKPLSSVQTVAVNSKPYLSVPPMLTTIPPVQHAASVVVTHTLSGPTTHSLSPSLQPTSSKQPAPTPAVHSTRTAKRKFSPDKNQPPAKRTQTSCTIS